MKNQSILKKVFFLKTLVFSLLIQGDLIAKESKLNELTEMKEVQEEIDIASTQKEKAEVLSFVSTEYRKITNKKSNENNSYIPPQIQPPVDVPGMPEVPEPPIQPPNDSVVIWKNGQEIINTKNYSLETNLVTDGNNHGLRAIEEGTVVVNKGKLVLTPSLSRVIDNSGNIIEGLFKNHIFGALAHEKALIKNDGEIELTSSNPSSKVEQVGMGAFTEAQVINNGNIIGSAAAGIYASGKNSIGINNGNISFIGANGMITEGALIINNGTISNVGESGMKALDGGVAINTKDGIIENKKIATDKFSGKYGMFAKGKDSQIINEGIIRNEENGGLKVEEGALGINNNLIQNKGQGGISVTGRGSLGINNSIIENEKRTGIGANEGATAINNGIIRNKDNFGMQASGEGSTVINNEKGIIENTGNRGLVGSSLGVAHNFGIINNTKGSSLYAESKGTVINEESGKVISKASNGAYIKALGVGINKGTISNGSSNGALITLGGTFINEKTGIIENKGEYGIFIGADTDGNFEGIRSNAINKGTIKNKGNYGVLVKTGTSNYNGATTQLTSYFINEETGVIENEGNVGITVRGDLTQNIANPEAESYALNKGTIKNRGDKGMHTAGGIIINSSTGKIENTGNYRMYGEDYSTVINEGNLAIEGEGQTAIYVDDNSIAINKGEIKVGGNNGTGMYARNNSTILNEGIIKLEGTNGIGLHAYGAGSKIENKGTIILADKSEITGNISEEKKDAQENIAIKLEAGATFTNSGKFKVEGDLDFSEMGTGKFEISQGGTIEANSIKGNLYASGALALGSYEDKYSTYKMLKTNKMDGEVKSNSAMFDAKVTKNDSNGFYDVILDRKSFEEITNNEILGNYLEKNYNDNSNSKKLSLYDAYKLLATNKELNNAIDNTFGTRIYPNIQKQTYDIIKFNNNKIENNVFDIIPATDLRYIAGYDYSVFDIDSSNSLEGYITKLSGIYLGMDKKVSSSYRMGGLFNLTENHTNFTHTAKREDKTYQGTLFSIYEKDSLKVTNTIFTGTNRGDLKRNYSFSTINENLKGKLKNNYFGLNNSIENKIEFENGYFLKPKVSLNYINLDQKEIKESGDYGIKIDSLNSHSLEGKIELEFGKKFNFENNSYLELKPIIAYRYEMLNPYKDIDASISTLSEDNYKIDAYNAKRGNVEFGVKVEFGKSELKSYIEYLNVQNEVKNMHITSFGIAYSW